MKPVPAAQEQREMLAVFAVEPAMVAETKVAEQRGFLTVATVWVALEQQE